MTKDEKNAIILEFGKSDKDVGCSAVQIAILTARITELTEHLYDQDFDRDSNIIEVFVGRLRKKLEADLIETVRGLGYRLRAPEGAG